MARTDPTAARIASNVKRLRREKRVTLDQLASRLLDLDWPISSQSLSKIETGARGISASDVVALARALGETPNKLLLADPPTESVQLTPTDDVATRDAWRWARGLDPLPFPGDDTSLTDENGVVQYSEIVDRAAQAQAFARSNQPDDPPDDTPYEEVLRRFPEEIAALHALGRSAHKKGMSMKWLAAHLLWLEDYQRFLDESHLRYTSAQSRTLLRAIVESPQALDDSSLVCGECPGCRAGGDCEARQG